MTGDLVPSTDLYRRLFLHSLLIIIVAFLLTTVLHEGAHAVTARAFGLHPVLHHNCTFTPEVDSSSARLAIPRPGRSSHWCKASSSWQARPRTTLPSAPTVLPPP